MMDGVLIWEGMGDGVGADAGAAAAEDGGAGGGGGGAEEAAATTGSTVFTQPSPGQTTMVDVNLDVLGRGGMETGKRM
jgi:hypothetical protein